MKCTIMKRTFHTFAHFHTNKMLEIYNKTELCESQTPIRCFAICVELFLLYKNKEAVTLRDRNNKLILHFSCTVHDVIPKGKTSYTITNAQIFCTVPYTKRS